MKTKYFSFILLLIANCSVAQVKHAVTKSTISFKIKNLGFNTNGVISGLQGNIQFDPANLGASSIQASVATNTINTDNDMRDEHLRSESFFDVTKYPQITIKSISLKHKDGNNYTGQFSLTIKDKTQTVEMPFTYIATGGNATFTGSMKLKRSDYGIGGSSVVLSNDIYVTVVVETSK